MAEPDPHTHGRSPLRLPSQGATAVLQTTTAAAQLTVGVNWQISNVWHPEVSDSCAYDCACNAKSAVSISKGGSDWTPWSTYNSGAYKQYLSYGQQCCDNTFAAIRNSTNSSIKPSNTSEAVKNALRAAEQLRVAQDAARAAEKPLPDASKRLNASCLGPRQGVREPPV